MDLIRNFDSFYELIEYFQDEETWKSHLEKVRWNGNPTCPKCGHEKVYTLNVKGIGKRWKCAGCRKQFSVTTGTIFHSSILPFVNGSLRFTLSLHIRKVLAHTS